jgi:hypothetical protein
VLVSLAVMGYSSNVHRVSLQNRSLPSGMPPGILAQASYL